MVNNENVQRGLITSVVILSGLNGKCRIMMKLLLFDPDPRTSHDIYRRQMGEKNSHEISFCFR